METPNPNRVNFVNSTNNTNWQMIATDGVGYASYTALQSAGKTKYPGSVNDFPNGIPFFQARCDNGAGAAGSGFYIRTNTISSPTEDDNIVVGSPSEEVYNEGAVWSVWIKKVVGTDVIYGHGMY